MMLLCHNVSWETWLQTVISAALTSLFIYV